MALTYTLIQATTLTATSLTVTFSSIPSTYTDLLLRVSARNDAAFAGGNADTFAIVLNSSTSANYSDTAVYGTGTTVGSTRLSNDTYWELMRSNGSLTTSNTFSSIEIYIPNYAGSANKVSSQFSVVENNATTNNAIWGTAALWQVTSAITSITIDNTPTGNNFVANSTFQLYGILKA